MIFMRKLALVILLVSVVLLFFILPEVHCEEQGLTAKVAFQRAQKEALSWQKDAALFEVGSANISNDGSLKKGDVTSQWNLAFYSPATKKVLTVVVAIPTAPPLRDVSSFEGGSTFKQVLSADFIDSNQVVETAKKNGFKSEGSTSMYLTFTFIKSLKKSMHVWYIMDDIDPTLTKYYIDPKTGKFLGKE